MNPQSPLALILALLSAIVMVTPAGGARGALECGKTGHNILGDERITSPWTALVLTRAPNGTFQDWAGGVIVGPHTVLTTGDGVPTAHPSAIRVGVGIGNRKNRTRDRFAQLLEADYVYVRPQARRPTPGQSRSLTVIQLKTAIKFSTRVRPVCIEVGSGILERTSPDLDFQKHPKLVSGYRATGDHALVHRPLNDSWTWGDRGTGTSNRWGGAGAGAGCPDAGDELSVGSSFAVWKNTRWHLVGIARTNAQDPVNCHQGLSNFIDVIGPADVGWIAATTRNGGKSQFTCFSGEPVPLVSLCDGKVDCKGASDGFDEQESFCAAWKCPPGSKDCGSAPENPTATPAKVIPTLRPSPTTTELPSPNDHDTVDSRGTPVRCPPLAPKEGTGVLHRCTPRHSNASTSCLHPSEPGTRLSPVCALNHRPVTQDTGPVQICGPDGVWKPTSPRLKELQCSQECGTPKAAFGTRIVNGSRVRAHTNWPWNAALFRRSKRPSEDPAYICGATLISSDALLTAAHCVTAYATPFAEHPENYTVVLVPASSEFSRNTRAANSLIVGIASIHVHENYNHRTLEADLAILRLATEVPASAQAHVYPICVPTAGRSVELVERAQTSVGSVGSVLGFGLDASSRISPTLQATQLPIVAPRECWEVSNLFPTVAQLCAGVRGTVLCNGDSGAGFVFQQQDGPRSFFIQGVVSHGKHDQDRLACDPTKYSIFTRVGAFKSWIEEVLTNS